MQRKRGNQQRNYYTESFREVRAFEDVLALSVTNNYMRGSIRVMDNTHRYLIVGNRQGHYCAYVEVEHGHPVYGMWYTHIYDWIPTSPDVNGGITFTDDLCSEDGVVDGFDYCIGWDYAHSWNDGKEVTEQRILGDVGNCAIWLDNVALMKQFTCPTCKQHTDKIHT